MQDVSVTARYPIARFEDAIELYGSLLLLSTYEFSAPLPKWRDIELELLNQWVKVTGQEKIQQAA